MAVAGKLACDYMATDSVSFTDKTILNNDPILGDHSGVGAQKIENRSKNEGTCSQSNPSTARYNEKTDKMLSHENREVDTNLETISAYLKNLSGSGKQESFNPTTPFDKKPLWYNEEKFKRGQQFAMDHLFSVTYAEILSLYLLFSIDSNLDPLIFTDRSHTPYKAFERYLSTLTRVMSWYEGDPWKEGTAAQQHIKTVNGMHRNLQTKLISSKPEELQRQITLNGKCPVWSTIKSTVLDDFQSACPEPAFATNPFCRGGVWVNQCDMGLTQFAFVGMAVTYPQKFGIHDATDEDLEGFLHVWRTLGYLLGIQDKYNFCNGDLETVRERTRDFIDVSVKPSLRNVSEGWEHMCRCVVSGIAFYVPTFTFEVSLAYLCSNILNIPMPCLTNTFSMWDSFMYRSVDFCLNVLFKLPGVTSVFNKMLIIAINNAKNASPETLKKWEGSEFS